MFQPCSCQAGKSIVSHRLDVFLIQPVELIEVKQRRTTYDPVDREGLGELLAGNDHRLIIERPANQTEEIEHGIRQIAHVFIRRNTVIAVALGQLLAIFADNYRQMAVLGRLHAQGVECL